MKKSERIDYENRMERLKRVAKTLKKESKDSQFDGADYRLGFHFLFNEILVFQNEFDARYKGDFESNPLLKEYNQRLAQILETAHSVLIDSISPAENNKKAAARRKKLKAFPASEKSEAQATEKAAEKPMDAPPAKKSTKRTGQTKKPKS